MLRDVRRIILIGGSLIGVLLGLWVVLQATGSAGLIAPRGRPRRLTAALPSAPCQPRDAPSARDPRRSSSHRLSASRSLPGCGHERSTSSSASSTSSASAVRSGAAIARGHLSSLLLWGPPGTGKTSLARLLAGEIGAHFTTLSAVMSGVADVRATIAEAQDRLALNGTRTVLFLDEIHRFNKAQQDALLPHVEDGTVTLIGATTENPYFEVNSALLSRMRVWRLEALTDEEVGDRRPSRARRTPIAASPARSGRRAASRSPTTLRAPVSSRRRRCPRRAERPGGGGRARRGRGDPRRGGPGQPAARGRRDRRPAARPRLRPSRRRPLRHGLGVHQEPARQRPRRRPVLARVDDRGRRGPAVHRPAADHQRVGGRRQRRPAGAPGRGRGGPGARPRRAAGGAVRAGPGDDLHRDRAEVEPSGSAYWAAVGRCRSARARCPSHSICGPPRSTDAAARHRGRLPLPARLRGRRRRPAVPARRADDRRYYLPTDQGYEATIANRMEARAERRAAGKPKRSPSPNRRLRRVPAASSCGRARRTARNWPRPRSRTRPARQAWPRISSRAAQTAITK